MVTYTLSGLVSALQQLIRELTALGDKQDYFKDGWKLDDKGFVQKDRLKRLETHIHDLESLLSRLDRLITEIVRLKMLWIAAVRAQVGELVAGGEGVVKDVLECHLQVDAKAVNLCRYAMQQIEAQLELLRSILRQVKLINAMTM